jgi:3-phenylpropionate/cinnamic acid dioxygenase small subunit
VSDDGDAIRNLLYRYAELIDAGDLDGVGTLFEHASVDWGGDVTEGSAAVTERLAASTRLHDDGTPRTSHVITNAIVEVDGERASARSRYTVFQVTADRSLQPIIAGRYDDTFERADTGWRFASRRYRVDLIGDLSNHLPADLIERLAPPDR